MLASGPGSRHRGRSPAERLRVAGRDVPVQPVGRAHRVVGEPGDRLEREPVRADLAEHHPAAGGAEVDRGDGDRLIGATCRNAAATPASTGMCSPVVWVRSGPHERERPRWRRARAAPRA